jgi:hypothetical protein
MYEKCIFPTFDKVFQIIRLKSLIDFRPGIRKRNLVILIPDQRFEATKRLFLNITAQNCSTILKTVSAFAKSTDLLVQT